VTIGSVKSKVFLQSAHGTLLFAHLKPVHVYGVYYVNRYGGTFLWEPYCCGSDNSVEKDTAQLKECFQVKLLLWEPVEEGSLSRLKNSNTLRAKKVNRFRVPSRRRPILNVQKRRPASSSDTTTRSARDPESFSGILRHATSVPQSEKKSV
jgi:hypothetical protein